MTCPFPIRAIRTTMYKSFLSLRKFFVRMHQDNINLSRLSPFSAGKPSQRGDRGSRSEQNTQTIQPLWLRLCRAESIRG